MASEWMLWIHPNFHRPELDPYHVETFRLNFALDKSRISDLLVLVILSVL